MATAMSRFFKVDLKNANEVSIVRLYLLRLYFVSMFVGVGVPAWREIFFHQGIWDPLHGVAYSFWAAYSTLMILGLRHPLKMLPFLLLQFFYKLVWMLAVVYPLWSSGALSDPFIKRLAVLFLWAMLADLVLVPWPFAMRSYFGRELRHG